MQKESICRGQMALKGDAVWGLLTHHQPNGRSPALEKGGYIRRIPGQGPLCKKETICRRQMALKEDAAGGLLTHHQPYGWSPALVKGGYTLGLAPIAFWQVLRR